MMKWMRPWLALIATTLVFFALLAVAILQRNVRPTTTPSDAVAPKAAAAPPELARHRSDFRHGVEAIQQGDGPRAIRHLTSFSFEGRAIEEYRLYFLANAYQLARQETPARRTLASLWRRHPKLVYRNDVAFHLGSLYAERGAWNAAARVYGELAARADSSAVAAAARKEYIEAKLYAGDPGAMLFAADNIAIQNPNAQEAPDAIALARAVRSLPRDASLPFTFDERIDRASNLLRDGDPQAALNELAPFDALSLPVSYAQRIRLTRGVALSALRRFEESERSLQPLFSGEYRYAIPALQTSGRNQRALAASTNPFKTRTVKERKRVGTETIRRKGKKIRRPKYQNVFRTEKLVILHLKTKKEEHERLFVERQKDLLALPAPENIKKEALLTLIGRAAEKNQDEYLVQLITQVVKLDPTLDVGLQRFWDKGWAAYARGDFVTAREKFLFITTIYQSPNIQRQTRYWYARALERSKETERARQIYAELASAPYEDLYSIFAQRRGATRREPPSGNPFLDAPDWNQIADEEMPDELRLAYELNALGLRREARLEVQQNARDSNRRYADAILGELFFTEGAIVPAHKFLLRAFPKLGSVEQDSVPRRFLEIYYPMRFHDIIESKAKKYGVDPFLLMGLIRQESIYEPNARSRVGATGLTQLMPPTARELGRRLYGSFKESQMTDPTTNIEIGAYYLRWLLNMSGGSEEMALASYNGGLGNVRKWRRAAPKRPMDEFVESIPFPETKGYVKRVTFYRAAYRRLYP